MPDNIIKINDDKFDHWTMRATHDLEHALRSVIDTAKRAEVPQGLIVALLVGITHQETATMVEGS